MRLTPDVIASASSRINPALERELDLRGYKAPAIENLGVTADTYDAIDFTDNELVRLDNFPVMKRLSAVYASNNMISRISSSVAENVPNLQVLVLTNNRVSSLTELDSLSALKQLRLLSLLHNPITRKQHYRYFVIHTLPQLRLLDFTKITKKERISAAKFFLSKAGKVFLAELRKTTTVPVAEGSIPAAGAEALPAQAAPKSAYTPEQLEAIQKAISAASTPAEIAELEQQLKAGIIPSLTQ